MILNGDILELALTTDSAAAMDFERFIELIAPDEGRKLFDRIVCCRATTIITYGRRPGNPVAEYLKAKVAWGEPIKIPWHSTYLFNKTVPSYFLNRVVQRWPILKDLTIETAYPNFGLLSPDGRRGVIFHHGHFIESIYLLMSTLKTMLFPDRPMPREAWDLEAENFAWIDFFWSAWAGPARVGKGFGHCLWKSSWTTTREKAPG